MSASKIKSTIVLGASAKPDRYSYKAMHMLAESRHPVVGVHPKLASVGDFLVFPTLTKAADALVQVDTITLYVSADRSLPMLPEILAIKPNRVIFNPGAENAELYQSLRDQGIAVLNACTLVLLRTGQY